MQVTAIIPAYNEAANIAPVIQTVRSTNSIAEVIVVSDGSTDDTVNVARREGARVVDLKTNIGKAGALLAGAKATEAEIIVMLDADLKGLQPFHIEKLLLPVCEEGYDMSVGIFTSGRLRTDLAQWLTPFLSGQRALRRKILLELEDYSSTKFGIDILLSKYARSKGYKVKHVSIPNVTQVMKEEKMGFRRGAVERLKMYWQIIKVLTKIW